MTSQHVPQVWRDALAELFRRAAEAGYGFMRGTHGFEAIPGLEDAAADYIETQMKEMFPDD